MSFSFGSSDKNTTSQQNQVSNPWAPTQPLLQTLLGQMGGLPTSVTPGQTGAFNQLEANAAAGDPNAASTRALSSELLNARDNSGTVDSAYGLLRSQLGGIADSNPDPTQNPGVQGMLSTVGSDITNKINQEFAAAGRDMSGANTQTLARGLAQGEAPILLNQYNTNVANKMAASQALKDAGYGAVTTNQGLDAARAALQEQGVGVGDTALAQSNYAPNSILQIEQQKTQLPYTNLGMLASVLYPMAGLGGQVSGTGTANTNTTSFGLGGNILSDERAKDEKQEIGELKDGTPIYRFKYKGDDVTRIGPMAQDVEKREPAAVQEDERTGLKTVNMDLATRKAAQIARDRASRKLARAH